MDRTNRNTALASAMVEELARCGVRDAVLSPGSRSTPLALALWREPAIEARVVVDERSAGYFALGAAQVTGRPVAILCTSGTAAANLHPAVCEADEAGVPLIALSADRPPELRGIGAGQTIDQIKLYGSAVRWFCELGTHDADDAGLLHFRSVACRGFAAAAGDPRPGPVHLNIAWRDPLGPEPRQGDVTASSALALKGREGRSGGDPPLTTVPRAISAPAEALVDALVEPDPRRATRPDRRRAQPGPHGRPGNRRPRPGDRLPGSRRADVATPARPARSKPGRVVIRADRPRSAQAADTGPGAAVRRHADLQAAAPMAVLAAGGTPDRGRPARRLERADPDRGGDRPRRPGGARAALSIARLAGAATEPRWAETWLAAAEAAESAIGAELAGLDRPTEPGVHAALGGLYADGDLVYTASSMPIRDQEAFLPAGDADVLFLANRGANGIDGLISSGIGAASASGRPTWIVTGDVGLHHDSNALASLRHADAPIRIVVLNNDGGGIFEFLPQAGQFGRDEFEAILGTPPGLEPERVAALYEVPYGRITDLSELAGASAETALIEVPVDRATNVALHERLGELAAEALERTLA